MTTISRYARCIEILSMLVMPVFLFLLIFKWTYGIFVSNNPHSFVVAFGVGDTIPYSFENIPLLSQIAGIVIDGVSVSIFLAGLYYVIQIMRLFQQGRTFSLPTLAAFKALSKLALCNALFSPLRATLLTFFTTLHNPPGQRYLAVSIGSGDVINIVVFVFFLVITSVMYEGYRLQKEQELTV